MKKFLLLWHVLSVWIHWLIQFHNDRTIRIIGPSILHSMEAYPFYDLHHSTTLIYLTYRLLYDTPSENDSKKSTASSPHRTIVWSRISYNIGSHNQNNNGRMMRNNRLNNSYFSTTLYFISSL